MTDRHGRAHARRWFRKWLLILGLPLLALAVYGFLIEPARLVERDYTLSLPEWPGACEGLRLDVVSDTHTGSPRNGLDNLDRWVAKLAESDSDAVLHSLLKLAA